MNHDRYAGSVIRKKGLTVDLKPVYGEDLEKVQDQQAPSHNLHGQPGSCPKIGSMSQTPASPEVVLAQTTSSQEPRYP